MHKCARQVETSRAGLTGARVSVTVPALGCVLLARAT